jgi:hypothetical protein
VSSEAERKETKMRKVMDKVLAAAELALMAIGEFLSDLPTVVIMMWMME